MGNLLDEILHNLDVSWQHTFSLMLPLPLGAVADSDTSAVFRGGTASSAEGICEYVE